jgi:hypothetical protein
LVDCVVAPLVGVKFSAKCRRFGLSHPASTVNSWSDAVDRPLDRNTIRTSHGAGYRLDPAAGFAAVMPDPLLTSI